CASTCARAPSPRMRSAEPSVLLLPKAPLNLIPIPVCPLEYRPLVDCQHLPMLHNDLPIDYHRLYIGGFRCVDELRIDVVNRSLMRRTKVHHYHVRTFADFD